VKSFSNGSFGVNSFRHRVPNIQPLRYELPKKRVHCLAE